MTPGKPGFDLNDLYQQTDVSAFCCWEVEEGWKISRMNPVENAILAFFLVGISSGLHEELPFPFAAGVNDFSCWQNQGHAGKG